MPALTAPNYDEHHWLIICAMISGSPNQPAAWALLIVSGIGLSLRSRS